jgi:hypothetical protein
VGEAFAPFRGRGDRNQIRLGARARAATVKLVPRDTIEGEKLDSPRDNLQ